MARKIALLALLVALAGTALYADVCTATISVAKPMKTIIYTIGIDYGQGKAESLKTESMTDFIINMDSKGWKIEAYYSLGEGVVQIVFRK